LSEFDLINQFFKTAAIKRDDVLLGIGDDCAILSPPAGKQLVVSTDTLISGVHFPELTCAEDIGYKSLAVNLSDLAAMGAEPAWVSLAISLPQANDVWLQRFMRGFNELAGQYQLSLIGGDTTQGPLSISINITGFIDSEKALKRSRAKVGDSIFVTGNIGAAALGLKTAFDELDASNQFTEKNKMDCIARLNRPTPRVKAGLLLSDFSVAAIDISDGLLADLNHICEASGAGAILDVQAIPLSSAVRNYYNDHPDWQSILDGGDDYELCFTCPEHQAEKMLAQMKLYSIDVSCIGKIIKETAIKCLYNNQLVTLTPSGYNHFK